MLRDRTWNLSKTMTILPRPLIPYKHYAHTLHTRCGIPRDWARPCKHGSQPWRRTLATQLLTPHKVCIFLFENRTHAHSVQG